MQTSTTRHKRRLLVHLARSHRRADEQYDAGTVTVMRRLPSPILSRQRPGNCRDIDYFHASAQAEACTRLCLPLLGTMRSGEIARTRRLSQYHPERRMPETDSRQEKTYLMARCHLNWTSR